MNIDRGDINEFMQIMREINQSLKKLSSCVNYDNQIRTTKYDD